MSKENLTNVNKRKYYKRMQAFKASYFPSKIQANKYSRKGFSRRIFRDLYNNHIVKDQRIKSIESHGIDGFFNTFSKNSKSLLVGARCTLDGGLTSPHPINTLYSNLHCASADNEKIHISTGAVFSHTQFSIPATIQATTLGIAMFDINDVKVFEASANHLYPVRFYTRPWTMGLLEKYDENYAHDLAYTLHNRYNFNDVYVKLSDNGIAVIAYDYLTTDLKRFWFNWKINQAAKVYHKS